MVQDHDHLWLFYSGSLWGRKPSGIGIHVALPWSVPAPSHSTMRGFPLMPTG